MTWLGFLLKLTVADPPLFRSTIHSKLARGDIAGKS